MRIIDSLDEMMETARGWLAGGTVGFVPITSTLHEGHKVLIHTARKVSEIVVVCIIKKSLLPDTDALIFEHDYNFIQDLHLLSEQNIDVVFMPHAQELYPPNFSMYVTPDNALATSLKAAISSQHLRTFATTMTKLFQLVRPDILFCGQKDAHQIAIMQQLIRDLNLDTALYVVPTIREGNGLAMSSRNRFLSAPELQAATILHRGLLKAKTAIDSGEKQTAEIIQILTHAVTTPQIKLEQINICHPETFVAVSEIRPGTLIALQTSIGTVPLIDNIIWLPNGQWRV